MLIRAAIFLCSFYMGSMFAQGSKTMNSLASKTLTVEDVINRIKKQVTCDWSLETVDNLKCGDPRQEVTGIVTSFMATMDVIEKAVAVGANLIITHEPTFYNHTDGKLRHPQQDDK